MTVRPAFLLATISMLIVHDGRGLQTNQPAYCLGFENLDLSRGERLSKFDFHIESGAVTSIPRVPLGWRIVIDNEANGMPTVSGIAIEQAADLEQSEFATDFIRLAATPENAWEPGTHHNMIVRGQLQFTRGDTTRAVAISLNNVTLTPERGCLRSR